MSRILAIDPGSRVTGWASVSDGRLVASGAVSASRLGLLARRLSEVLEDQEPTHLVIERHPVTHRRAAPSDAWGPGIAAGIVVGLWIAAAGGRPREPRTVSVQDWRRAMLGLIGPSQRAKAAAVQRARAELSDVGLRLSAPGSRQVDEAEAVCLAVYAARVLELR